MGSATKAAPAITVAAAHGVTAASMSAAGPTVAAASMLGAHRHYRNNQEKRREGKRATHI
jgi:hypothetical protein